MQAENCRDNHSSWISSLFPEGEEGARDGMSKLTQPTTYQDWSLRQSPSPWPQSERLGQECPQPQQNIQTEPAGRDSFHRSKQNNKYKQMLFTGVLPTNCPGMSKRSCPQRIPPHQRLGVINRKSKIGNVHLRCSLKKIQGINVKESKTEGPQFQRCSNLNAPDVSTSPSGCPFYLFNLLYHPLRAQERK